MPALVSRSLIAGGAAHIQALGLSRSRLRMAPLGSTLAFNKHLGVAELLSGTTAFRQALGLERASAFLWEAPLRWTGVSHAETSSAGIRRSAFFPIILRMLAEGYRRG